MVSAAQGGNVYAGYAVVLFNATRLEEPAYKFAAETRVKMAADIENIFILLKYGGEFFGC